MRLIFGLLYLFLLVQCIESLNFTDLGLPNNNHCAYSTNQTLYILGQNNVSITFGSPWNTDPPKISIQPNNTSRRIACTITRSGQVVLFPSSQSNITYGGSQAAIDRFITNTIPLEDYATVGFNDYVLIQGGRDNNRTEYSTTYILDTRFPTQWTWYELTNTSFTPPPASSNTSLAATSRWILYFRTEHVGGPNYLTTVDCFDPYSFLWLGTVTTFNTTTNLIQAVPIVSSAPGTDSLLLVPAWSDQTESNVTTNGLMRLDISTWVYNDVRMTTASTKRDVVEYKPVAGGTVTRVTSTDLVVFYGGRDLSFFNATSLEFLTQPRWLDNNTTVQHNDSSDSSRNRNLPIILGSVMGGLLFIAVVALFIWCMMRRKRSLHQNRQQQQEDMWVCWPFIPKKNTYDTANTKDESLPYVLSPIQATSPIQMFQNDEKPVLTSRFIEHFDYHSFPLSRNNNRASASMQNIATSSFGSSQIPRSASSYV